MLRPEDEVAEVDTQEFMDRRLRYNQKEYRRLVRELYQRGPVVPLEDGVERVGLFAVWKEKGVRQRLIVDARRANARFRVPPGVDLLTAEALSRVEIEGSPVELELFRLHFGGFRAGCPDTSPCPRCRPRTSA
jgi:hypothetical protein